MPGYEADFVSELLKRHECPICLQAMKNPVQTECGHLFCKDCLEPIFKRRAPMCPIDQEELTREETFPDNACRREILGLQVYCNFKTSGCEWVGPLSLLENHLEGCGYQEVQCSQCGRYIHQRALEQHQSIECSMRPAPCPHCGNRVPAEQMKAHIEKVCPEVHHLCPNNCDPTLQMKLTEVKHHIDPRTGDCPLTEVSCPYVQHGCQFKHRRRIELHHHMEAFSIQHAYLQSDFDTTVKNEQLSVLKEARRLNDRQTHTEERLAAVERTLDHLEGRLDVLDTDRKERHSERVTPRVRLLEDKVSQLQINVESAQKQVDFPGIGMVDDTFALVSHNHHTGAASSSYGRGSLGASSAYSSAVSQRVETLYTKVTELDHTVNRYITSSFDQDLRLQLLERATHDGMLLWKIDDFSRRKREAVDGITLSLYSTPFYTSHQGYKMCARVYLNGDGMGKSSHLSFFFVIMKGPYDALLPWPFRQKVTLMLINQETGHKDVVDSFRPDPDSNSFQRPVKRDMNIASGCPMFCRLDHLLTNGFVKEDCIFLGVVVDTANIPQPLPPKSVANSTPYYS